MQLTSKLAIFDLKSTSRLAFSTSVVIFGCRVTFEVHISERVSTHPLPPLNIPPCNAKPCQHPCPPPLQCKTRQEQRLSSILRIFFNHALSLQVQDRLHRFSIVFFSAGSQQEGCILFDHQLRATLPKKEHFCDC